MTHKERMLNALSRKSVDKFPHGDGLWGETRQKYIAEGKLGKDEDECTHFDMSWRGGGWLNSTGDLDFQDQILEETEETRLVLNGNGAILRSWKHRTGTPEHVDFKVKERSAWEDMIKPKLLTVDRRRIPFEWYRNEKTLARAGDRAVCWIGMAPFEQMHPLCGHEHMLAGMALDPEWVLDMVMTFSRMAIKHLDILFAEEGLPDFIWFFEDMGFKDKPFMSPTMYEELVMPGHKLLFDYAHARGLKVVVHSCGFIEPLVPGLIKAGMDCLQAMEVKAGMDLARLAARFGDQITFCGGIDVRILATNDRDLIEAEINRKILPVLKGGSGYIVHSDHSIPPDVEYDTLRWFFERASTIVSRL